MKLKIDENAIKQKLVDLLTAGLNGKLYSIKSNVRLNAPFAKIIYADVVVYDIDHKPIAVFEVKPFAQGWVMRRQMDSSLPRTLDVQGVRFYVITDDDEFYIMTSSDQEFVKTDVDTIIKIINQGLPALGLPPSISEIKTAFEKIATEVNLEQKSTILSFVEKTRPQPLFSMDETTGWIEFKNRTDEDNFFSYLLDGRIPSSLCRFTTRHNLFELLRDGKQNMCSIVCMNDRSEESYSDNWVGLKSSGGNIQLENNNCFILSLMPQEKSDDLTMWRLYGDDAKGVCLNYQVIDQQKGRKLKGDFYISCINYGIDERTHPELDFIHNLLTLNLNHWHFHLKRWYIWKHFFKSFRFKDEKEVRLLYISDGKETVEKKWIENVESGIISKMLLFPMIPTNSFPLNLTNIIVGPKSPEPRKIVEQFSFILNQEWNSYSPVYVRESSIKEYR